MSDPLDEWDFYFCRVDEKPASIFVDLGVETDVPREDLPDLLFVRLHMKSPREDGLSSDEEFPALVEVENVLQNAVLDSAIEAKRERVRYVGRNTSGGCRDFFFYTDDGAWGERLLRQVLADASGYGIESGEIEIGGRTDPEWTAYRDFLAPSERDRQTMENRKLLDALEENGDDPSVVRPVQHWVWFPAAEERDGFAVRARADGFRTSETSGDAKRGSPRPFGLVVTRDIDVEPTTIHPETLKLFDLACEHDGDYDGWESEVRRSGGG